ncbi:MAG: hypothetical protein PWQ97_980 [Tepidanaerobacteraceae bacterium]|nr:hypothetical protein [Tepidanaerobacteraceae bacterium]
MDAALNFFMFLEGKIPIQTVIYFLIYFYEGKNILWQTMDL